MDLMQKLGGRKFLLALVAIGAAMFLEIKTEKGLSTEMTGLLLGLVGAFSVANYATSAKHMQTKGPNGTADGAVHKKLDHIQTLISEGINGESVGIMTEMFKKFNNDLDQVKVTTGQIGQTLVNLGKRG